MSRSYLFFAPSVLPLATDDLSEETVRPFASSAAVREALDRLFDDLAWEPAPPEGVPLHGTVVRDEAPYEFSVSPALPGASGAGGVSLGLRCSGRVDSEAFVQRICDATGWVAFDDRPRCFQPHRPPMPA